MLGCKKNAREITSDMLNPAQDLWTRYLIWGRTATLSQAWPIPREQGWPLCKAREVAGHDALQTFSSAGLRENTFSQKLTISSIRQSSPAEIAIHSSTLAWRIPRTEEPGGLQSMASKRFEHDWATFTFSFSWRRMTSFKPYTFHSYLLMFNRDTMVMKCGK